MARLQLEKEVRELKLSVQQLALQACTASRPAACRPGPLRLSFTIRLLVTAPRSYSPSSFDRAPPRVTTQAEADQRTIEATQAQRAQLEEKCAEQAREIAAATDLR